MSNVVTTLSDVAICNMAVNLLDDIRINDLEDDTTVARFCARQYFLIRDELLRSYPWSFAMAMEVLAPEAEAPGFGWQYSYRLPTRALRLLPLTERGAYNGRAIKYEKQGQHVYTNYGPALYARFVERQTAASEFDPLFARALGSLVAIYGSMGITGKASYYDRAKDSFNMALTTAKQTDSLDRGPAEQPIDDDIHTVRSGGLRMLGSYGQGSS